MWIQLQLKPFSGYEFVSSKIQINYGYILRLCIFKKII